jgi:AcrR family transcriptional regulator
MLFAKKGFDAVSIREIANQAEVQTSTIYYYFHNKRGVYIGILERSLSELTEILEAALLEGKDPLDRLKRYIYSYTEFLHRNYKTAYLVSQVIFNEDDDLKDLIKQIWAKHYFMVEDILQEGIEMGVFRPVDTHLMTINIRGMMLWYFFSLPITKLFPGMENLNMESNEILASETIDVILNGILTKD